MAATVEVRVHHGAAPGLGVDATGQTLRLKRADDDVQDPNNPVPITAVVEYSWRKSFRLVVVTPPDNSIDNLRFFSDGPSGVLGVGRRILFDRSAAYNQATAADETVAISAVDVTVKTDVSPEIVQPGELVNDGDAFPTAFGAGSSQDFVELQLEVSPSAGVGNSASTMTLRYRYDER